MNNWKNVYVFVSSTFSDMHAERDYLVKRVFPRLTEWCEQRRLRMVGIDLRWGVSEADVRDNKLVVRVCLDRIDQCRPFFLGFVGQRRGRVMAADDVGEETRHRFPRLARYLGNCSLTELEVIHATIDPMHGGSFAGPDGQPRDGSACEHALFFLRDPSYLDTWSELEPSPAALARSQELREIYTNAAEPEPDAVDAEVAHWRNTTIPSTGRPVAHYRARWHAEDRQPEIALPLTVPTTAAPGSAAWTDALRQWRQRWAGVGVTVDDIGELAGAELARATAFNEALTRGRLGTFTVGDRELADVIVDDLQRAIAARHPDHMTPASRTPLQRELDQQEQVLRIACEGFIGRSADLDVLARYVNGADARPLAVVGPAGVGKTSLLAHFVDTHGTGSYGHPPHETLLYRFVGGSDDSVTVDRLLRSILTELTSAGRIEASIPDDPADLVNQLPGLLREAGQAGPTILVIDALNQLESVDLHWLPSPLPPGVKLIVSGTDELFDRSRNGTVLIHTIEPFNRVEDRRALVSAYLALHFKELDESRIEALISSAGAGNPLFLRTALSELRVFGVHHELSRMIATRFGTTPVSAFAAVLERLESDPAYTKVDPRHLIPRIFGWLGHSRHGLSPGQLADLVRRDGLTSDPTEAADAVAVVLHQLRPFLARRDGRVDFFYDSFRTAARQRYAGDHPSARPPAEWHRDLATYFATLPIDDHHRLMEQAWQYWHAGMVDDYERLVFHYPYVERRLAQFGPELLVEDCALSQASDVRLLAGFYRLATPALRLDRHRLATQLWGRMSGFANPRWQALLRDAAQAQSARGAWLRPILPCLDRPGGHVERVYRPRDAALGFCLALSPDDRTMATELRPGKVALWDVDTGRLLATVPVPGARSFVTGLRWAPDGSTFAARISHNNIYVWDARRHDLVARIDADLMTYTYLNGNQSWGLNVGFEYTSDSRGIIAQTSSGHLTVFDVRDGSVLSSSLVEGVAPELGAGPGPMPAHAYGVGGGRLVAVARYAREWEQRSGTFNWLIWWIGLYDDDRANGTLVRRPKVLDGHARPARLLAVSPDDRLVASSVDGNVSLWDAEEASLLTRAQVDRSGKVTALRFLDDGRRLLTAGYDGFIRVLAIPDLTVVSEAQPGFGGIVAVAPLADETRCLALSESGQEIRLVSLAAPGATAQTSCGEAITNIGLDKERGLVVASSYHNFIGPGLVPTVTPVQRGGIHFFRASDHRLLETRRYPEAMNQDLVYVAPSGDSVVAKDCMVERPGAIKARAVVKCWRLDGQSRTTYSFFGVPDFRPSSQGRMFANNVRFSSDSRHAIAYKALSGTLAVYEVSSGRQLCELPLPGCQSERHDAPGAEYEVSPDGTTLFVFHYATGHLDRYHTGTGVRLDVSKVAGYHPVEPPDDYPLLSRGPHNGGLALSGDGSTLLFHDRVSVWLIDMSDLRAGFHLDRRSHKPGASRADINCFAAINHDASRLACSRLIEPPGRTDLQSSRDECLDVWDTRSGQLIARFVAEGHISNALIEGNLYTFGLANGEICTAALEGDSR